MLRCARLWPSLSWRCIRARTVHTGALAKLCLCSMVIPASAFAPVSVVMPGYADL